MAKKQERIRAVAYLRKSTKGKRGGQEKQEKSLVHQKRDLMTLAARENYEIVEWFEDEGISGNKRGAARPSYTAMLAAVAELKAQVILVDHLNRFHRGKRQYVEEDLRRLVAATSVRLVRTPEKSYDLTRSIEEEEDNIGDMLGLVFDIWQNHRYVTDQSRKVLQGMRDNGEAGKWNGGPVPLGYVAIKDGDGKIVGLKLGAKRDVELVRWIFDQFVNRGRSMNWIAHDLNARKILSSLGKMWRPASVKSLLTLRTYIGSYTWNDQSNGEHYRIDGDGEITKSQKAEGHKVYETPDVYPALIDKKLFNRAQQRVLKIGSTGRGRKAMYALSGILRCGHCGSVLTACQPNGKTVYRCPGSKEKGTRFCAAPYQVREQQILPFLMKMLGEEIKNLEELLVASAAPDELRFPRKGEQERRQRLEQEREELVRQIAACTKNLARCEDDRIWKDLTVELKQMKDRVDALDAELVERPKRKSYTNAEMQALADWYANFNETCVSVPLKDVPNDRTFWHRDRSHEPEDDDDNMYHYLVDGQVVNAKLKELNASVEFWWKTIPGKQRPRHIIVKGRFRLGQKEGVVPVKSFQRYGSPLPWKVITLLAQVDRLFSGDALRAG